MRRSELKVGDKLYYAPGRDWRDHPHEGGKATVVDTGRYRRLDYWEQKQAGLDHPWAEHQRGSMVLVDRDLGGGVVRREAVLPAHLRGPWEQLRAEVAERAELKRRQAREAGRVREVAEHARQEVIDRAVGLNIDARRPADVTGASDAARYVAVPHAELDVLLRLLELDRTGR